MAVSENQRILEEEMNRLRDDIIDVYQQSGKKTSGEFERGLELRYNSTTSATLLGYEYLGGRRAGKMPPLQTIERWIRLKGLRPIEDKMSISSLAFLIARKIKQEGTKKSNNLAIYTKVITPERIDEIFNRLQTVNANAFIQDVITTITKAFNQYQ